MIGKSARGLPIYYSFHEPERPGPVGSQTTTRPDFDFRSDVHRPSLFCPMLSLEQHLDRAYRVHEIAARRLQMALQSHERFSTFEWANYWFGRAMACLYELESMIERREPYLVKIAPLCPTTVELPETLWGIWREEAQPVRGPGWVEIDGKRLECHEEQAHNIANMLNGLSDEMTGVEGARYEAREIRL